MTDFFRRYVAHNLGLKVISLLLAVGLWLAVSRDPMAEVGVEVPVEFHHIPENLEISSEAIPQAQIRVRGPERIIHRLRPTDVHAEIDLRSIKPGEHTFDLTAEQINKPHGLDVVQIVPSQFHLDFDARLTRQVPVRPRVVGSFARGYEIGEVQTDPPTVSIVGPKRRVETVEAAITDPIDVSGTMQRGSFVTHAYVPDPLVQIMHSGPVRVTVIMKRVPPASGGQ